MDLNDIMRAAQLACALEVSAHPKPGNVHRTADFEVMKFEHFLASSIAIGPAILDVTRRGFEAAEERIELSEIGIGSAIKAAIDDTTKWQSDGNTNLGIVLLLAPLSAAAGMTLAKDMRIGMEALRDNLSNVLKSTTPEDALNTYDAILAVAPEGIGEVEELDVRYESSRQRITDEGISLYEIMKMASKRDNVAKEWVTDMRITFEFGHPTVERIHMETENVNSTTVQTFLEILANYPDTFIQRVYDKQTSKEVSDSVKEILEAGGILTTKGRGLILKLDADLRKRRVNPGTTADLTVSSLMLAILNGLRP